MTNLNQFYSDNADRINGIANANNVDTGTAQAMLVSNIMNGTNYSGGGVADMNQLKTAYQNALTKDNTSSTDNYYTSARNTADKQYQNQTNLINSQTNSAIKALNKQKEQAKTNYEQQQRENYINNELQKKNLNDYLSAMGYTGGMAETTAMNLANNYQNNVNTAQTEYNNNISDIDELIEQARLSGNESLYNALVDRNNAYLSLLQEENNNQLALEQAQAEAYADQLKESNSNAMDILKLYANGGLTGQQASELLKGTAYEGAITSTGYNPNKIKTTSSGSTSSGISNAQALSLYKMYLSGDINESDASTLLSGTPYGNLLNQSASTTATNDSTLKDWQTDLADAQSGRLTPQTIYTYRDSLVSKYGENGYKTLLNESYKMMY